VLEMLLGTSIRLQQGVINLVDRPSQLMESNQLDKDSVRCLKLGMGGSLQKCNNRGTLVPEQSYVPITSITSPVFRNGAWSSGETCKIVGLVVLPLLQHWLS